MGAECHVCGADLAYDLSCGRCGMKAERDTAQSERDQLLAGVREEIERLRAEADLTRQFSLRPSEPESERRLARAVYREETERADRLQHLADSIEEVEGE